MPASLRSYFSMSPIVCPHVCFLLDGMTAFSRSRLPLSRIVSQCVPVLDSDNVSAFQRFYHIPGLPLSPHMCPCVGWCVHLPKVLSPLVSHYLPLSPHMCACVRWPVRLELISQLVSQLDCLPFCLPACLPACLSSCLHLLRVV